MERPVLATETSAERIYEGMRDFTDRLADGDPTLLDEDEGPGGAAFAGEHYHAIYRRAVREGEADRVRTIPWGIGAAIARATTELDEPAVFFACRTQDDRRYWRMVSASGTIVHRDDLPMLRLIDPAGQEPCSIPDDRDLEELFAVAASDIVGEHNQPAKAPAPPATQRWALKTSSALQTRQAVTRTAWQPTCCRYRRAHLSAGRCRICGASMVRAG